ncbi:MAG: NTP transferase domain-containing protein [Methanosarcinales archaeon Met12]|nr:MAG: NTP transferase domain-containing protein [Methanosarcinales archaeon Met12]
MDALVMAGGPGNRLGEGEKPLISLCGNPMISYVLDALRQSDKVDEIFVVTSPYTPETRRCLKDKFRVIEAGGVGYVSDLVEATESLELKSPFLIVMADLPLLSAKLIDEVIEIYSKITKPALSVYVPLRVCREVGVRPDIVLNNNGELTVPVGVNILDGRLIREEQDEHRLVLAQRELAVNVNTVNDLVVCERILSAKKGKRSLGDSQL